MKLYQRTKGNLDAPKRNAKILAEYFGVSIPYLLGLDDNPVLVNPGSAKEILKASPKCFREKVRLKIKSLNGLLLEKILLLYLQSSINQRHCLITLIF